MSVLIWSVSKTNEGVLFPEESVIIWLDEGRFLIGSTNNGWSLLDIETKTQEIVWHPNDVPKNFVLGDDLGETDVDADDVAATKINNFIRGRSNSPIH